VAYTFTSLLAKTFISARKGAFSLVDRVEAVDRYAVRFTLQQPFGGVETKWSKLVKVERALIHGSGSL
jgi:hypothetical protein